MVQGDVGISPFARSHMGFVNRPPVHPGHPDPEGRGQSTPPIPATEIEARMLEAGELARHAPEAVSAPADIRIRQVLAGSGITAIRVGPVWVLDSSNGDTKQAAARSGACMGPAYRCRQSG